MAGSGARPIRREPGIGESTVRRYLDLFTSLLMVPGFPLLGELLTVGK